MRIIAFLAYKDLRRDRKIFLLVSVLLAFSYVNLTFFPAFLNGLSDTFQSEAIDTGTSHIIIQPSVESKQTYLSSVLGTQKKIGLIPGVVGSSAQISLAGTASFEGKELGIRLTALMPSEDGTVTAIQSKVLKGDFLADADTDEVVLGESVAGKRIEDSIGKETGFGRAIEGLGGVDAGQRIKIKFSNSIEKSYKVKGIAGSQGFNLVSQSAFITRKEAENVLGIKDQASSILVRLNDKNEADRYKKMILELGLVNVNVQTWEEASAFASGINQTFGIVVLVTTFVGIVVVMVTVGVVIFINTSRKKRIIGVLKAIGMQKNQILLIFLLESFIFGVIGTLMGAAIVYLSVFYLSVNPIQLPIGSLRPILFAGTAINAIAVLIAFSVIAGYLPARMASKQDVLENIRVVE